MKLSRKSVVAALVGAALTFSLAGCGDSSAPDKGAASSDAAAADTLVIENSFDIKSADPGRQYEPTSSIITKAMYETLLTYEGSDITHLVDGLASYTMSDDAKVVTLTMKEGNKFSDGSPVTVDDAVFSLQRVQGMEGNPSFLLADVTIAKVDDKTLTLTSKEPALELPSKLSNQSLSVLNSKVVKENGGTTDKDDKAEAFLAKTSAGSGPYKLESFDVASQVTMVANENYVGDAPKYKKVVLRNAPAATQMLNVQSGTSQIALDLAASQAKEIDPAKADVTSLSATTTVFLFANQNPEVCKYTANPKFVSALKKAVDYDKVVSLAGGDGKQAAGIVPDNVLGGLKDASLKRDLEGAKADLAEAGYNGEEIALAYADDLSVQGVELKTIAAALQAQLKEAGINATLAPAPVAKELDAYRNGKEQIGLWYWNPDYADPANYLAFSAGEKVGLRAGWAADADADVTAAMNKAHDAAEESARAKAFEEFQTALNAKSPFIPLLQPGKSVAVAKGVGELSLNPLWTLDIAKIK